MYEISYIRIWFFEIEYLEVKPRDRCSLLKASTRTTRPVSGTKGVSTKINVSCHFTWSSPFQYSIMKIIRQIKQSEKKMYRHKFVHFSRFQSSFPFINALIFKDKNQYFKENTTWTATSTIIAVNVAKIVSL